MLNWNPQSSASVEFLTRAAPQPDRVWMTLFTVIPRILKHMAHLTPIDAEYEKLLSTLTTLSTSAPSSPEGASTNELTTEEIRLAKILVPVTKAFQTLYTAIVAQNSNSPSKEEPSKTTAAIKELLTSAATLLKRDGAIKSTGVIPWQTFHSLTTTVETVAYLNVTNQCLLNLIATKANKKATFKAANAVIQDFMAQCRQALQAVQTDVTALRNVVKPDRIKSGLLYEICDGSAFDFVRSPVSLSCVFFFFSFFIFLFLCLPGGVRHVSLFVLPLI